MLGQPKATVHWRDLVLVVDDDDDNDDDELFLRNCRPTKDV